MQMRAATEPRDRSVAAHLPILKLDNAIGAFEVGVIMTTMTVLGGPFK